MSDLVEELEVIADPQIEMPPSWNVAPTTLIHVLGVRDGSRVVRLMEWGLLPKWSKDKSRQSSMINARVESAHEKPSFRNLVRRHRCLVPISGFYEWDRSGEKKQPYFFGPTNGEILTVAALWSSWTDPETSIDHATVAMLTTTANQDLLNIHDRMPCLVSSEDRIDWLDSSLDPLSALSNLYAIEPGQLKATKVSTAVNSVRNNDPSLLEPLP